VLYNVYYSFFINLNVFYWQNCDVFYIFTAALHVCSFIHVAAKWRLRNVLSCIAGNAIEQQWCMQIFQQFRVQTSKCNLHWTRFQNIYLKLQFEHRHSWNPGRGGQALCYSFCGQRREKSSRANKMLVTAILPTKDGSNMDFWGSPSVAFCPTAMLVADNIRSRRSVVCGI
jgi:hypothetical protein